jgi:CheY-like chemotaxis protein
MDCTILIVEDDADARAAWERDIEDFNSEATDGFKYHPVFAATRAAALRELDRIRINCAVVDLRLPAGEEQDKDAVKNPIGNEIIERVLLEIGVPAVVYSGHVAEASALIRASNIRIESKRGNGGAEILQQFAAQADLMSAMDEARKRIAIESAKLFGTFLWPRWQKKWKRNHNRETLANMLTRQVASHVADRLAQPPAAAHHPDEFYVIPPLFSERLDTGDLIKDNGTTWVVVTPRCNLANGELPNQLTLAACRPMGAEWDEIRNMKEDKGIRRVRNFATQGHSTSTHFLPPCDGEGPWLVDFSELRTVDSAIVPQLINKRFASIATNFVPNLVQRYSAYQGRIGQPDIDHIVLLSALKVD